MSVNKLYSTALDKLAQLLSGASRVALINFPNHSNPGDSAIWLGTRRLLSDMGVEVGYAAAHWNFDPLYLKRAVGNAPVLLSGGGNLGDLYMPQQGTRMRAVEALPDNPIIQLPQSIYFRDEKKADQVGKALRAHPNFTLMLRERLSMKWAFAQWGIKAMLSPDHAFGLAPLDRNAWARPTNSILWLTRKPGDHEYAGHTQPNGPDVKRIDWLASIQQHQAHWDLVGQSALAVNYLIHKFQYTLGRWAHVLAARTYEPLAQRWVNSGLDLLSSSYVVVTDRLHGHLLCAMLGIPHVVLDNSYAKVSSTLNTWTKDLPGVYTATDSNEALYIAKSLVEKEMQSWC